MLVGVVVAHRVQGVAPGLAVAVAQLVVDLGHRRVAVQAGAGLLEARSGALGVPLVLQRPLVAARLVVVHGESVSAPHLLSPGLGVDTGDRVVLARVIGGGIDFDEVSVGVLGGLLVLLVLDGEVLSPHGRVVGRVGQLDRLSEGGLRLLLVLEDGDQQPGEGGRCHGDDDQDGDWYPPPARPGPGGGLFGALRLRLAGRLCCLGAHAASPLVPDAVVAADARHRLALASRTVGGLIDEVAMAVEAGRLGDLTIVLADLDILRIVLKGELQRVPEAVVRLVDVLVDDIVVRRVTGVAGGHIMVAAPLPGLVLFLHGVAVRAGGRIIAEVAGDARVLEGEDAYPQEDAHQPREGDPRPSDEGTREAAPQRRDEAYHAASPRTP